MSEKTFLYVMTCVDKHMLKVLHMLVNYRNCQISVNSLKYLWRHFQQFFWTYESLSVLCFEMNKSQILAGITKCTALQCFACISIEYKYAIVGDWMMNSNSLLIAVYGVCEHVILKYDKIICLNNKNASWCHEQVAFRIVCW